MYTRHGCSGSFLVFAAGNQSDSLNMLRVIRLATIAAGSGATSLANVARCGGLSREKKIRHQIYGDISLQTIYTES